MPVVSAPQLRRFMSNPHWSPEQTQVAEELCQQVESTLSDALGGTPITPMPFVESAPVIASTGQVDTQFPVYSVQDIDGTAYPEGAPLPLGWHIRNGWLFTGDQTGGYGSGGSVAVSELYTWASAWGGPTGRTYGRSIRLTYQAGWGPHPTLINAILRKAAAFMEHRHSDVVVARGLDPADPPPAPTEEWTANELAALGRFRRLGVGRT